MAPDQPKPTTPGPSPARERLWASLPRATSGPPLLSHDDVTLLLCLATGSGDGATGATLQPWSPLTTVAVRSRVRELRRRLGAASRAHLVARAIQLGILRLDRQGPQVLQLPRKDGS